MIKQVGLFGTATLYLYIRVHTKNGCGRAFYSLTLLHQKQNVYNFDKCCEISNTIINVEVIQISHLKIDLASLLNDIYAIPDPKTVNINHVFQVKKYLAHIGYHQELHDEAEPKHDYKNDNA